MGAVQATIREAVQATIRETVQATIHGVIQGEGFRCVRVRHTSMAPNVVLSAFAIGFGVVGVLVLYRGSSLLQATVRALTGDPTAPVALDDRTGPVRVQGEARKAAATVRAPYSGTDCLAYEYEARQRAPGGDWETVDAGAKAIPFYVDDGEARVRVEPTTSSLHVREYVTEVPAGREPPEAVRRIGRTRGVNSGDRTVDLSVVELETDHEQAFVERRLEAGERVSVFGALQRQAVDGDDRVVDGVVRAADGTSLILVGEDAPAPSRTWYLTGAVTRVGAGLALLGIAAAVGLAAFPG